MRRSNAEIAHDKKLKEQCQMMETYLNNLEEVCRSPNIEQKEDLVGTVGLYVGKAMLCFLNIEQITGVYEDGFIPPTYIDNDNSKKKK
jgi:hypothetical protein